MLCSPWGHKELGMTLLNFMAGLYDLNGYGPVALPLASLRFSFPYTCSTTRYSVQFSLVTQSCPTLCDPMGYSTTGLPVHRQLPEPTQTHVHRVGDAIQPCHPLSSPSPPALNLSQHQGLFQGVSISHQAAKVLEFQLQHQSFQ